jgi:protein KTI12
MSWDEVPPRLEKRRSKFFDHLPSRLLKKMALVIVSGLACSGRSRRSQELQDDFIRRTNELSSTLSTPLRVIRLCNKDVNIRPSQFSTQKLEKPARAAYLSLVTRNLSRQTIVIADGGAGTNIKGFRYQLWCAARETGVRCVSVLCVSNKEQCKRRNDKRRAEGDEQAYDEET